jgi:hypothetical protein
MLPLLEPEDRWISLSVVAVTRFQTSRQVRRVVVCAYSRMVDDDAVVSALAFKLRRH